MTTHEAHDTPRTVLVAGATGKTGRRVADRLHARGVSVQAGTRSDVPPFDWNDPTSWAPALRSADAAYVTYHPDPAVPSAADTIAAFSKLAVAGGTRRLVLLSRLGEAEAQRSEEALRRTGADWTVLRSSWLMQNLSESFFLEPLLRGELALPADGVREPFVDADDIAVAARNAQLADGVEQALGRPPRDFRDYARDAAAAGVWTATQIGA